MCCAGGLFGGVFTHLTAGTGCGQEISCIRVVKRTGRGSHGASRVLSLVRSIRFTCGLRRRRFGVGKTVACRRTSGDCAGGSSCEACSFCCNTRYQLGLPLGLGLCAIIEDVGHEKCGSRTSGAAR